MRYYPHIEYQKEKNESGTVFNLTTILRVKDKFYFLVKIKHQYQITTEDIISHDYILSQLYNKLLSEIENYKNSKFDPTLYEIDKYQGDDIKNIDMSKMFKYYYPDMTYEQLLGMMITDLEYKSSLFPSKESEEAIKNLKLALFWLEERQKDREKRNVIGTYQK